MSREKQIDEMANVIKLSLDSLGCGNFNFTGEEISTMFAEALYNAGYRKQSEGEWIPSDIPQEKYVCSVCGGACWYYDYQGEVAKSRCCPNCGAEMKGEEMAKKYFTPEEVRKMSQSEVRDNYTAIIDSIKKWGCE